MHFCCSTTVTGHCTPRLTVYLQACVAVVLSSTRPVSALYAGTTKQHTRLCHLGGSTFTVHSTTTRTTTALQESHWQPSFRSLPVATNKSRPNVSRHPSQAWHCCLSSRLHSSASCVTANHQQAQTSHVSLPQSMPKSGSGRNPCKACFAVAAHSLE
jgi:hypothetical protein